MTTYRSVEFVSCGEAGSRDGDANTVVISINNTFGGIQELQPGWKDVLVLQFDPVDSLMNAHGLKRFTLGQAEQILDFVGKHAETATDILVHCTKGEQRSAAVAQVLARMYNLPFPDDYEMCHRWVLKVFRSVLRQRGM
jgi:predicted protein tyrosine phosphatase